MTLMDCTLVQGRLSDLADGYVIDSERRDLELHLASCKSCLRRFDDYRALRRTLRSLPEPQMPASLVYTLRSKASHAATRQRLYAGFGGWLREKADNFALRTNNLMRPLAVPAVGGLFSAVLLFVAVMTNFQGIIIAQANDVPTALATEASVITTPPLSFEPQDIVLDVLVDETGRVIDYSFPEGYGSLKTAQMRRRLEHSLLFTQFKPATAFGQPVVGWVRVSFQKEKIDVSD